MFYRKLKQGQALLVSSPLNSGDPVRVTFIGCIVWPWERAELVDITVKKIELAVPALCKDLKAVLARVYFWVKVNRETQDVLEVARNVGCKNTFLADTCERLFAEKFQEAVKVAVNRFEFSELLSKWQELREEIHAFIGRDLNGYFVEDLVIQDIVPRDSQTMVLGSEELTVDWLEVKQAGRLDSLISRHGIAVLARRRPDGSVEVTPPGDTLIGAGEELAVAVASSRYEALKGEMSGS